MGVARCVDAPGQSSRLRPPINTEPSHRSPEVFAGHLLFLFRYGCYGRDCPRRGGEDQLQREPFYALSNSPAKEHLNGAPMLRCAGLHHASGAAPLWES
jgi:hypothetical protein